MEAVGHLNRLRGSTGGAVGINPAPITADDFRSGMQLQPSSQAVGGTVRQQVNGSVRLQIDQDGPITLTFAPGPIVDAHRPRTSHLHGWSYLQSPKNGIGAGCHTESLQKPSPCLAAQYV